MKNILVPVDFSPVSQRAVDLAQHFANNMSSAIWLVHVAAPDPDFVGFGTGPRYVRDQRADELKKEHGQIQEMAEALRAKGIKAEGLLVQGPTSTTIVEEAGRLNADLIIMGSHGHGAIYKTFVGSVSEQVLGESQVPVLIIPSKGS